MLYRVKNYFDIWYFFVSSIKLLVKKLLLFIISYYYLKSSQIWQINNLKIIFFSSKILKFISNEKYTNPGRTSSKDITKTMVVL